LEEAIETGKHGAAADVKLRPLLSMQVEAQKDVSKAWWDLAALLIVRYNDGFLNFEKEDSIDRLAMDGEFLEKTGMSCNSMYSTWPNPADNHFPWTLAELQSPADLKRPAEAEVWRMCAPGTEAEQIAVDMATTTQRFCIDNSTPESQPVYSYLTPIVFGVVLLSMGILIGRNSNKSAPEHYQRMAA